MHEVAARDARLRGVTVHPGPGRPIVVIGVTAALLAAVGFLSLMYGAVTLSPAEAWQGLTSSADPFTRNVVWEIRFPRIVDGMLAGAALAVAGNLLQGVTRNPLADPSILGVTAAAALGSATVVVADPSAPEWAVVLACVGGGLGGSAILFVLAWRGATSPVRLALAGVALSAFFGAVIVGLLASSRVYLQTSLGFLTGGLYGAEWESLHGALPWVAAGLGAALLLGGQLNALALGDDVATGLGVRTERTRAGILAVAGLLTGTAVAIAGLVGFVGLVCPHLARFVVGQDHRWLMPVSALFGALLVTAADLAARTIIAPTELPMGIITAGIGAPFLLYLVKFRT